MGRRGEWVWNTEKQTEKREGGVSFQSDACQALTKVLVFWGDVTWIGGMDELEGTQLSSRDYFKEVCTVPFRLYFSIPNDVGSVS